MNEEIQIVKISVRTLVEFLLRSGDLTSGGMGVRNIEAMQEGSRIHRKIQKSMGVGYEAEVPLAIQIPIIIPATDPLSDNGTDEVTETDGSDEVKGVQEQGDLSDEGDESFILQIEGRADGVYRTKRRDSDSYDGSNADSDNDSQKDDDSVNVPEEDVLIDEIKGVYFDINELDEPETVHLAQARVYAYIVLTQENLPEIDVQITYCQMETERIRRFTIKHTADEITEWFDDLIEQYKPWAIYEWNHGKQRNKTIDALKFPYEYRPGQDDLVAFSYKQIVAGNRLFIEAPTGVGKTITTIFPSVKLMGEGRADRIFYLTAKTITRTVAENCFSILKEQDLCFKPITLTAKEKLCILDRVNCDPAQCERAKGHYDRVNDALYDLLTNEDSLTRDVITEYAEKHSVCPFELSLDAALFADAVIGDYNYVFDPNVYLRRFFSTQKKGDMILLIDEAHNLVERGREMYSATIVKEDFLAIARLMRSMSKKERRADVLYSLIQMTRAVESVNRTMLEYKRKCDRFLIIEDAEKLTIPLYRVASAYEIMAAEMKGPLPDREVFVEFYFSVRNFLAVLEEYDDHYRTYANYDSEGNFRFTLQCMDPSRRLREVCDRAKAAVFFSATLLPIRYYKEQLGGDVTDPAVYAKSSFTEEQREVLVATDVTSLYRSRGPEMYDRIALYILRFVAARMGNYIIYFPSYAFMDEVASRLTVPDGYELLIQGRHMSEAEREEFLNSFASASVDEDANIHATAEANGQVNPVSECSADSRNHVGLCVMGGIFSEGIDLTGDRLIGAAVVGTGLPMVCDERELFKAYFDEKKGRGFDYAYLYPGLCKVFQAGGRVIRTATDRGVILLLDGRFRRDDVRSEFPREWMKYREVTVDTVDAALQSFWNG